MSHMRVVPLPTLACMQDMKLQITQFRSSYMSWRKGNAKGARGQAKDVVRTQRLLEKPEPKYNKFQPRLGLWLADLPSTKFAVGPPSAVPAPAAATEGREQRGVRASGRKGGGGVAVSQLHHRDRRRIEAASSSSSSTRSRANVFAVAGQANYHGVAKQPATGKIFPIPCLVAHAVLFVCGYTGGRAKPAMAAMAHGSGKFAVGVATRQRVQTTVPDR